MWFKVDDKFHSHDKVAETEEPKAAAGLWTLCGSWSADYGRDGFVPLSIVRRYDGETEAAELVRVGLWRTVEGGFQFHDWAVYQPSKADVDAKREARAEAGRRGGVKSGEARRAKQNRSKAEANAKQNEANVNPDPVPDPEPETLVVTTTCQSSPLTREHDDGPVDNSSTESLDGINVYAVQRSVAEHCGLDIDVFTANRLAGEIITRSTEPVKRPTAYVQTAIRNEPDAIRAYLEGVAA